MNLESLQNLKSRNLEINVAKKTQEFKKPQIPKTREFGFSKTPNPEIMNSENIQIVNPQVHEKRELLNSRNNKKHESWNLHIHEITKSINREFWKS